MARNSDALQILASGSPEDPVVMILSVEPGSEIPKPNVDGRSLGERRRALRAWRESLKQDLMAYLQNEQGGQAEITNALPGTSNVIVEAPRRWWRKELLGHGRLSSMPLDLTPNDISVELID